MQSNGNVPRSQHIRELRAALWRNGYRPVAINRDTKFPYQKQWQIKARRDPPHACINVTDYMPGTGLLCDGLRAVDVDLDDPLLAATMHAYITDNFGAVPYRYREGSPRRVWLFRADDGEPRKAYVVNEHTKARLEVLGKGNQVFAFGIHPESGQLLEWSVSPTLIVRDDLPVLTEEQVSDLLDFAANLIGATRKQHRVSNEPMPMRDLTGDEWPSGDIRSALNAIPNHRADYDRWVKITSATFDACGGNADGHKEWLAWSKQCSEFSEAEADKLWRDLFNSPSYYTAGTLSYEARANAPFWDRPSRAGFTPLRTFEQKD
jgi:hypothetical protein